MITNFREVKIYGEKSGKCVICNKHCIRKEKFYQTLNPFNKNKKGIPKTESEIYEELIKTVIAWKKKPIEHAKCE